MRTHGWSAILLQPCRKEPVSRRGTTWTTDDPLEVSRHRGNVGILAGPVAVLDFDVPGAALEMAEDLGPLRPTVETGSGKMHVYVRPVEGLPGRIFWNGARVGEIKRLPSEYVVCPPSLHPDTGRPYRWLVDPREPLPDLPAAWREYLCRDRPAFVPESRDGWPDPEPWAGPPAEEMLRRARTQPGARDRGNKVTFQCPGCVAEGHDRHGRDHAVVFPDGRFSCVVDPEHRRAIGAVLGVFAEPLSVAALERAYLMGRL
jgi:hypothetical protein